VEQLAPGASAGDHADVPATHPEHTGENAHKLVVGAALDGWGGQTHAQPPVRHAEHFIASRSRRDPDGQAQTIARLGQRRGVTT
jgi:hypothetical protein